MSHIPSKNLHLFGDQNQERLLLDAYRHGFARMKGNVCNALMSAGIMRLAVGGRRKGVTLDDRHPEFEDICALLQEMTGCGRGSAAVSPPAKPHRISPAFPLPKISVPQLRVLATLLRFGPLSVVDVAGRNPGATASFFGMHIGRLIERGILAEEDGVISIVPEVPEQYRAIVSAIWSRFEGTNVRFPPLRHEAPPARAWAYRSAADGAARIFGTDIRLRNLMALAKYGPMWANELICLTEPGAISEARDDAPFGRADLVQCWGEPGSRAMRLHPMFPAAAALHRFLVAFEKFYPLPDLIRDGEPPIAPDPEPWDGDRLAIFGSPIPTAILTSIPTMGWTFEALCCEVATGFHRENVKKAILRLENEGVLVGDRKRKPGPNVRLLTISPTMPARQEFLNLLQACHDAWPSIGKSVEAEMSRLHAKTAEHLRRRGLVPCTPACPHKPGKKHRGSNSAAFLETARQRAEAKRIAKTHLTRAH